MSIEAAIQTTLDANGALAAVIAERVAFGSRIQGDALPAVAFEVDGDQSETLAQTFRSCSVRVYCIASSAVDALSVAALVRTAMASLSGAIGDVTVSAAVYLGRDVMPLEVGEGDEAEPAVVEVRFNVFYG